MKDDEQQHQALTQEALSTDHPSDISVHREESRLVVQMKSVDLEIGAHSLEEGTGAFHIGGLDDPRIIIPEGCEVTLTFHNWDSTQPHGWRLIDARPPFAYPGELTNMAPAFPGADVKAGPNETATARFTASRPGFYTYFCPEPEHTQVGQYGSVEVTHS
ncbi:hypothetical protein [Sulfobacillus harzensis]|uniref:Blue (type 1) copper domain-containing protein n=1 Tax=Sulfobacillus harzensis TaxID=2729629 RepID=A0A7Y0L8X9_9FIRM|nr:hypothetical protein [Sulfobacillus harzensis]NMP24084.1 hypothetical protein [Sulfobacillus harzensis]